MKKLLLSLALLGVTALPAMAKTPVISDAYAYATPKTQQNGAAFLTIKDASGDKVISAKTDVADKAELHTHMMDGDTMQMRKVESFTVSEDGTLKLHAHGDHIMLMGLKAPLESGKTFPLTLTFEKAGAVETTVQIVAPGTVMEGDTPMDHMGHMGKAEEAGSQMDGMPEYGEHMMDGHSDEKNSHH